MIDLPISCFDSEFCRKLSQASLEAIQGAIDQRPMNPSFDQGVLALSR